MIQNIEKNKKYINEDIIIKDYLKKLNFLKKTTFNFENDGAIIKVPINNEIVVSQDTLVEKIHFFTKDSPKSIAIKSIRANLSDLASMGAKPYAYTMSLSLNSNINKSWLKEFSNSLFREQKKHNFYLLGGDIVKSRNISITITIFGLIKKGVHISRTGSMLKDDIWITGNIGNSCIGYMILKKKLFLKNRKIKNFFLNSFFYPDPPVKVATKLSKIMTSAIDISDGFYGDLEKLTINNSKGASIFTNLIPFSNNTRALLKNKKVSLNELLTWGDDYQIMFTSNAVNRSKINKLSKLYKCKITKIGQINSSKKIDFEGFNFKKNKKSYKHRI